MSKETGTRWTCDRCGSVEFVEGTQKSITFLQASFRLEDGGGDEPPEGWLQIPGAGHFCATCAAGYRMFLEDYMRNAPKKEG